LKLAAAEGQSLAVIFRPLRAQMDTSPAALRVALLPTPNGLTAEILKRRGGGPQRIRTVLADS
jgi:hypothetical protein